MKSPKSHGGKRKGSGRKPLDGKRTPTSVLFPQDVMTAIDSFRSTRGITQSRSGAIIDLVKAGLSVLKKE